MNGVSNSSRNIVKKATRRVARTLVTNIHVHVRSLACRTGKIVIGARSFPCLLGRTGLTFRKREGDGKTPIGCFRLIEVLTRRDRIANLSCHLRQRQITAAIGWCDAPGHHLYNREVVLPFSASHETLWRNDSAYDCLVILDYNIAPRRQGHGSAIFFHLADRSAQFTQGCVAVSLNDMRKILLHCGLQTGINLAPAHARRK
jgi:L,D-peptidoglycan transpeptidase YkuD (ErfK/YbiS/YcfS/YnhG family)